MDTLFDMSDSIPSLYNFQAVFFYEFICKQYLIQKGIFPSIMKCPNCMKLKKLSENMNNFRCKDSNCKRSVSIRKGSIFYNQNLELNKIMLLSCLWLNKTGVNNAVSLTGFSPNTVVDYFKKFREKIEESLDDYDEIIGGPGVYVQIDECKFGKRKYHRGHRVDGVWIVRGVEITDEKKVFLVEVKASSNSP